LVDLSAPHIVGAYLSSKDKKTLYILAESKNMWERRIAIVSTFYFIRKGEFNDSLNIAKVLLADKEDLLHKATGWMLRELGKRSSSILENFLNEYCTIMPRTMLRYAIERFSPAKRKAYLEGKIKAY
jgi:3-methyladenine DNA glycosylase AlkD